MVDLAALDLRLDFDDLKGLFQPKRFYDSMKRGHSSTTGDGVALPRVGGIGLRKDTVHGVVQSVLVHCVSLMVFLSGALVEVQLETNVIPSAWIKLQCI